MEEDEETGEGGDVGVVWRAVLLGMAFTILKGQSCFEM